MTEIDEASQNENVNGVGILTDGSIIGVGYIHLGNPEYGEFATMIKLDASGNPYPGFGTNGVLIPSVFDTYSQAFDCVIVNDSVIISAAYGDPDINQDFAIAKLDQDGNPDPNFGTNGISTLNIDQLTYGEKIIYCDDNKFYIGGTSGQSGLSAPRDFFLARYLYNGMIDASWDGDGYVKTAIGSAWDHAYSLDMAPDGKIVMVGMSAMGPTGDNDRALARYLNDYIPYYVVAQFTASSTEICEGNDITFTDMSIGNITSWNWTFEGGNPSTSTLQNPTITYNSAGNYDVTLIVSDGTITDTLIREEYISVVIGPVQVNLPTGVIELCQTYDTEYTTNSVENATSYTWEISPSDAGTINGNDTVGVFESSETWEGQYTVKVKANGLCGSGPWSTELECTLFKNPSTFLLIGDGTYCQGSLGAEIQLDGSEVGVDYELYIDNAPSGNIVAGTGDIISFGNFDQEGIYTVSGYTANCFEYMVGSIWVHEILPPEQPDMPVGPEIVCNNDSSIYTTTINPDVTNYYWTLDTPDAGTMSQNNDSVTVYWTKSFSGIANLYVAVENNCGLSPDSDPLGIEALSSPNPGITGSQTVCDYTQEEYQTVENPSNSYSWEVEGGSIVSGGGTYMITVEWDDPGIGYVWLTEENPNGCITSTDDFEVTIDECTSVKDKNVSAIKIFPNPASDKLFITLDHQTASTKVQLFNSLGKIVFANDITTETTKFELNVSYLSPGIYLIQISDSGNVFSDFVIIR